MLCLLAVAAFAAGCKEWKLQEDAETQEAEKARRTAAFVRAVESGDLQKVKELLDKGVDVNASYAGSDTVLHRAVDGRRADIVSLLVEHGADVNARGEHGKTPLHLAVWECVELVKILLEAGADVNARDDEGAQPIHCTTGDMSVLRLLVTHGADINATDYDGYTPMERAATCHEGSSPGLLEGYRELGGRSGEHLRAEIINAVSEGDAARVRELAARGADVNAKDAYGWSLLAHCTATCLWRDKGLAETLLELGADPNEELRDGAGLLHHAASYGRDEIVGTLLDNRADINAKDSNGCTPLDWVSYSALWDDEKYKDTVRLLKEQGGVSGRPYMVKLFGAVKAGDCGRVGRLLGGGADVNMRGLYQHTLLIEAVKSNDLAMAKLLLSRGANVGAKAGLTKCTALHVSAKYSGKTEAGGEIMRLLIEKEAEVDAVDTQGQTPLHRAAYADNAEGVRILLARGADMGPRDKEGMTALDIAEKWNRKAIIQLLSGGD